MMLKHFKFLLLSAMLLYVVGNGGYRQVLGTL